MNAYQQCTILTRELFSIELDNSWLTSALQDVNTTTITARNVSTNQIIVYAERRLESGQLQQC